MTTCIIKKHFGGHTIDFVGEAIPVIDSNSKRLVGVVSEADLFSAYSGITQKVREIETA